MAVDGDAASDAPHMLQTNTTPPIFPPPPSVSAAQPSIASDPNKPAAQTTNSYPPPTPTFQISSDAPSSSTTSLVKKDEPEDIEPENKNAEGESETSPPKPGPPLPQVNIKLLVISGQSKVMSFEPETTIGRMKELVWNMWPPEWTKEPALPPSPSYFRILYLGRVLADDQTLSSFNIPLAPIKTIMHLSVRTFPIPEDSEPKKALLAFSRRPGVPNRPSMGPNTQATPTNNAGVINSTNGNDVETNANARAQANQAAPGRRSARGANGGEAEGSHGGGCSCAIM